MTDHFEPLGLPRRFSVDLAALEREYLARSRQVHPDFHHLGSGAEQQASLEQSAALNEAYLAIKDPFRRAEYLLSLLGGPSAREEKALDQAFMLDMLDLRERIEAAKAAADRAAIAALEAELIGLRDGKMRAIAGQFDRYDGLTPDHVDRPGILLDIRRGLNAVKTVQSLLRDVEG